MITPKEEPVKKLKIKKEVKFDRGSIKLKDGTVLNYYEPIYKLIINIIIPDKEFMLLKEDLKEFANLDIRKLKRARSKRLLYIPFSYSIKKDQLEKIKEIISKYKRLSMNKYIYTELSGYKIIYPKNDFLTPALGHTQKREIEDITIRIGHSGLEKYYRKELSSSKDIILNIDLENQEALEKELDIIKKDLDASDVFAVSLNLDSGYVNSIASSNRVNLNNITRDNYVNLKPSIIQYIFDMDYLYKPFEIVEHKNILSKDRFLNKLNNLTNLGFFSKSNIDISNEITSSLLENSIKVNFMQLVKAYSIFYNDGVMKDFKIAQQNSISQKQVISKELANEIKELLEEFYTAKKDNKLTLEFEDHDKTATIKFKHFEENDIRYLKAYFIVDKRQKN
jgi:cell division protein FtsI/penicillin-binding protein 2